MWSPKCKNGCNTLDRHSLYPRFSSFWLIMLGFDTHWSDFSFRVSVLSIYAFVVGCNEVFWIVLGWFQCISIESIPAPFHNTESVLAKELIFYGRGNHIFWRWHRDFTNTWSRLSRYFFCLVWALLLRKLGFFAFLGRNPRNVEATVTLCIDTVFRTSFSSIETVCGCILMVWKSPTLCGCGLL